MKSSFLNLLILSTLFVISCQKQNLQSNLAISSQLVDIGIDLKSADILIINESIELSENENSSFKSNFLSNTVRLDPEYINETGIVFFNNYKFKKRNKQYYYDDRRENIIKNMSNPMLTNSNPIYFQSVNNIYNANLGSVSKYSFKNFDKFHDLVFEIENPVLIHPRISYSENNGISIVYSGYKNKSNNILKCSLTYNEKSLDFNFDLTNGSASIPVSEIKEKFGNDVNIDYLSIDLTWGNHEVFKNENVTIAAVSILTYRENMGLIIDPSKERINFLVYHFK